MKHVETAHFPARQAVNQRFEAVLQEAWGVWARLLQEEYLKGVFTLHDDARAFADQVRAGGQSAELRKMWVAVNETAGETYAISGSGARPVEAIDLDFRHRTRILEVRKETLARLTDEELQALGLKRV